MRTITASDVTALLDTLRAQYPAFQLRTKALMSSRCTTWNATIYVPEHWPFYAPVLQWLKLRHEAEHVRQFAELGSWRFALQYATGSGRFRLESDAFAAEMRAVAEVFSLETLRARRASYIAMLSGRSYYWMASEAKATAWVDATIAAVLTAPA